MARKKAVRCGTVIGVRLNPMDLTKLKQLCVATQCPASAVLRMLVRLAEPTHLPLMALPRRRTAEARREVAEESAASLA